MKMLLGKTNGWGASNTKVNSEFSSLSGVEIIAAILERNIDPVIERMVLALRDKVLLEFVDVVNKEKKERSILITGLTNWGQDKPLFERQKNLEQNVAEILDILKVDCLPEVTYRIGKFGVNKPRTVKLSGAKIIAAILERNTDPVIERMVLPLRDKVLLEFADAVNKEKKERSIVITGLTEWGQDKPLFERQKNFEQNVAEILDILKVDCLPEVTYRMGKFDVNKPRTVKVLLPSRSHWVRALSNAYLLRRSKFSNVYVRRSMSASERTREFELRQEARSRNEGKPTREWVVYRGQLKHVSELPRRRIQEN
ncbi:hypothetical protein OESDEN_03337 [Oesophagostomum dentatum]|uniref:Uncharacterized protein n=1 Tax=Oesophagostomum dentatum TaxID=61180 RepID=A0A0B1TLL6_OESDE|nr:hypothetical protein OESDEN_03337 [Oesophagostomum dentatum]